MFNLTYHSMWHWYRQYHALEELNNKQSGIIRKYEMMTGVYQSSDELMQENYDLKYGQRKDCVPNLEECSESLTIYKRKASTRGWVIAISVPVVAVIGYGAGTVIQKAKQ